MSHPSSLYRHAWASLFVALGLLIAGCEAFISPTMCTAEFVTYFVQVQTPDGAPADSVAITVRNANTGQVYDVCASVNCERTPPGQYYIFHDGLDAGSDGSHVRVSGVKDDFGFQANYVFRAGECHVQKVAGPDQVTLRR